MALVAIPADEPVDPEGTIDWVGAYLGVGALILFNFVWKCVSPRLSPLILEYSSFSSQAPIVGWSSAYEIVLLIISIIHFAAFAYWESRIAKEPILPFKIWKAPSFGILMLTIFFCFMSLGIFFWYMNIYMQTIRHDSLIRTGVQYLPLTIVGAANAFLAAWLAPRVSAQIVIGIACFAMVAMNTLLATIPTHLTYWAMAFPAMLLSAFTIDLIVTSAQIIASNTVSVKHQGVAGSLVGTLLSYGLSTGLGFAGTVEVNTFAGGNDLLHGYHCAAYLAVGLAAAALILGVGFIRIPKDIREETGEGEPKS